VASSPFPLHFRNPILGSKEWRTWNYRPRVPMLGVGLCRLSYPILFLNRIWDLELMLQAGRGKNVAGRSKELITRSKVPAPLGCVGYIESSMNIDDDDTGICRIRSPLPACPIYPQVLG